MAQTPQEDRLSGLQQNTKVVAKKAFTKIKEIKSFSDRVLFDSKVDSNFSEPIQSKPVVSIMGATTQDI